MENKLLTYFTPQVADVFTTLVSKAGKGVGLIGELA